MAALLGFDVYSPSEIAERVSQVGVAKARLPSVPLVMLGMLAGAFIALGSLYYVIVVADPALPHALQRVLGGTVFSLGLLLVVVAGAELFTGNNLLAMAWADGKLGTREVLFNWLVVCGANLVGAVGVASMVYLAGHADAYAATYLKIAAAKTSLPLVQAFFSGVMCNVLVCIAVWMALAGRSVVDKAVAIVFPISAFVAAGFEHCVANMYFLSLAAMLQAAAGEPVALSGIARNLVPVIAGNIVGGSVLVALVYYVIYRWPACARERSASDAPNADQMPTVR
jgi:formate transporter